MKPKNREDYRSLLDNHVLPAFRQRPVASIDTLAVRSWLASLVSGGLSASRAKHAYYVLFAVLEAAIQAGALLRNPAAGVRVPRSRRREMHFLSAAEVERLAEAIVPPYGLLVRFAAYTGLRAGELAALRVKRLDLLRGTVRVVESATEVGGRPALGETKTYAERTVRLPRFLREELAAYLAGRPGDPDGFVFTAPRGGPLRHNNFYQRIFCPALARAGLPAQVRFHDLRHTCAALLIAQGAHAKAIQAHLRERDRSHLHIELCLEMRSIVRRMRTSATSVAITTVLTWFSGSGTTAAAAAAIPAINAATAIIRSRLLILFAPVGTSVLPTPLFHYSARRNLNLRLVAGSGRPPEALPPRVNV